MTSKCISKLDRSRRSSSHDHGLQVHLQTRSITASKCISEFNLISASKCISELLDLGLQMHQETPSITASKCISELHHHGLQLHLQTRSIMASKCISEFNSITASKCISKLAPFRPPSASLSSLNQRLQVLLRLRSSTICRQIGHMYIYRET
jgi:hypothetical protein